MDAEARVLADSISPRGKRLTTLEVKFPRFVLAEFNTHRMLSRNSASSRAIPVAKQVNKLTADNMFVGEHWGSNKPGMQAGAELEGEVLEEVKAIWRETGRYVIEQAKRLEKLGLHKQKTNRIMEAFMWHTVIVTATEWDNFYALRDHPAAQPEIRDAAIVMREAMKASTPIELGYGEWHTPLILPEEDFPLPERIWISGGRCARVSYETHDGRRDPVEDVGLHDRLSNDGHMSPFEHQARPLEENEQQEGNFIGWYQHRSDFWYQANYADKLAKDAQETE